MYVEILLNFQLDTYPVVVKVKEKHTKGLCGSIMNLKINNVMKGYLHKIEDWFVVYDQRTMQDPSAEDGMLPLHPHDVAISSFSFYNGKEVEFEIIQYDGTIPILNAWNGYAKLVNTDENGKPLTYWGELKDRTCDHTNCREVCPECIPYIGYISEDCEAVKNWDSFVEQKNNELEVEKLAEDVYGKGVNCDYEEGFVDGYNKAKETLYTKEQLMEVIELARLIDYNGSNDYYMSEDEIIQALKP